jgi:D-glycero-D-manno-heptose 1,7-bisphosphate phosphatase
MMANAAVFIDRDGTINQEKNYLYRIKDWEWITGSIEAIKSFNDAGMLVIVVSNQAGVARGKYNEHDIEKLHAYVNDELSRFEAKIDAYYYCPHHPDFGVTRTCSCRKPLPGLIMQAQQDFDIDLDRSYMVGDKISDIHAGEAAGVKPLMVLTGYGMQEYEKCSSKVPCVKNLFAASEYILKFYKEAGNDKN